ncbi:uncharacterized protein LOC144638119 [Oculina patagonica]
MRTRLLLAFLYGYLCLHLALNDVSGEEEEENGDEEDEDPADEQFDIDADNMEDLAKEIAEKAIERQLEIMEEQQQRAQEFVDSKLDINIEPEKGWKTEDLFVPPGFHVDAEMTGEDEKPEGEAGDQPFLYPMGVGGMLMNACVGTNYQPGDPCYEAYWETTRCASMIDGAAFIGVGFDGRGDYSPESRKMSIVQRDCSGRSTYDDFDVPDTMNVHGVYDTSATMQTFYSRKEYQQSLQKQAGMAGSAFGFYGGVKKAWGSSTLSGSQKYMALFEIDIDRYEIYLDEVKPGDLSVNFLREFMDLPLSYLAPGAAKKFQNFILRWGTHYIKSGKFGGRLQVFKTMEGSQVSSKSDFSQVMEAEFRNLFSSFNAKSESKQSSSQKSQHKTSSTSITAEGGDQKIASIISDMESPTIKTELKQWLESIRTFPKPFKFMVAPITNLLKFNVHSLFPDEESDWGCEANKRRLKKDPHTDEYYYEIKINKTVVRKPCPYLDREALMFDMERRRNNLDVAIGVYMEEGPISPSDISLPAGEPGCQTENYNFQKKSERPTWEEMTHDSVPFVVIFTTREDLVGSLNGPSTIPAKMEKVVKFFNGKWFVGDDANDMDMTSSCKTKEGEEGENKICILGLTLEYYSDSGFLRLAAEDLEINKMNYKSLRQADVGRLFAHVEWTQDHAFRFQEVVGYLPCNVKWSNALRFDPSNTQGKCLHFTAVSEGTIFVVFAAVPNDRDTWYYVEISPFGVGIFKSQKLEVSTTDVSAVGLGSDVLYQSYFVCVTETSDRTVIEYGKSSRSTGHGDVFLTMVDSVDPKYVRWYSFGNGEETLQVVDAHILSRQFTKATCRGANGLDEETNMCTLGFECQSYKVLDQVDRGMSFSDLSEEKCDKEISSIAWYRMMGKAGDQIPEKCVPINRCSTRAPGWLNGKHPTVEDGIVTREVCYNWNDNCCNWKNKINIRNCGDFFVYQLQKPPTCSLRYCGNADECKSYQAVDQADRSMSFADENVVKCDQKEQDGMSFPGWYRFTGETGEQMPDKCVPTGRCGTKATGWLSGAHPTEQDGVVTREVCYHQDNNCCKWKNNIKVRNCGEFYVYELQKPPFL